MLAISMFGVTHGAEIITFSSEKEFPPLTREAHWVDLPIYLNDGIARSAEIYIVKRIHTKMGLLTWVGYYRHAVGIGLKRPGGYYGAGVWLLNTIAQGKAIVALLPLIADQIKALAMDGDNFHSSLEKIGGKVNFPQEEVNIIARSFAEVQDHGGLNPMADNEFFVDISDPADAHAAARCIDLALTGAGLSAFNGLSIGNDRDTAKALATRGWPTVRKPARPYSPPCLPGKQSLPGPRDVNRRVQRLRGLVVKLKSERSALTKELSSIRDGASALALPERAAMANEIARLKSHIDMREVPEDRSAVAPKIMLDEERIWAEMSQLRHLMQAVLDEQGKSRPANTDMDSRGLQAYEEDGGKPRAQGVSWRTALVRMYCIGSLLIFVVLGGGWAQGWYAGKGVQQPSGAPVPPVKVKEELIEIDPRAVEVLRAGRLAQMDHDAILGGGGSKNLRDDAKISILKTLP